jgi:hypothetical protein
MRPFVGTAMFCVPLPCGAELASAISKDYAISTEPARPGRQLRYVATARRADVSPHTLITADPAELLAVLAQPQLGKLPSGSNLAALRDVHSGRRHHNGTGEVPHR